MSCSELCVCDLLTGAGGGVVFPRTCLCYIRRHLEQHRFPQRSHSRVVFFEWMCVCVCVCVRVCVCECAVTFHFALEAVPVLLCESFLVGPLVLLGALTVVVHPFNRILLQMKMKDLHARLLNLLLQHKNYKNYSAKFVFFPPFAWCHISIYTLNLQ